ncbi:MAG: isocitrate lyase/PEP mutase family protein [Prochlorothrix sp.]|nr:isocitrate lyase/PEP mutase family protein [Prochlorothrix sp.]
MAIALTYPPNLAPMSNAAFARRQALRTALQQPTLLPAPAVYDCIGAKLAESAGFQAIFTSGFGTSAALLGLPDMGFLTATEMLEMAGNIARSVQIPVIADLDTGYGNELNVKRTIATAVERGISGVILEDQEWPKRCGHFEGKRVIPVEDQVQKLKAAVEARGESGLVIVARTDARAVEGLAAAIDRAQQYHAAGADVIFVEAPQSREELEAVVRAFPGVPLMANVIEGGKTPCLSAQALETMGYRLLAYALSGLFASVGAVRSYFQQLQATGEVTTTGDFVQFEEFKRLINLERYDRP